MNAELSREHLHSISTAMNGVFVKEAADAADLNWDDGICDSATPTTGRLSLWSCFRLVLLLMVLAADSPRPLSSC